jgi:methionyl-tRNA formyltransferase
MMASRDFDTILLLTGPIEAAALAGILSVRAPQLDIRHIESRAALDALDVETLAGARLIGYFTDVIVPQHILDAIGYGSYNFHPGSPDYPGWGPAHFAIYDQAPAFGVTAHVMHARVDSGPIIGSETFAVPPGTSVQRLEQFAFVALVRLFSDLAEALVLGAPLAELPIAWSGQTCTRRGIRAMRDVNAALSKNDLERRIAAFGEDQTGDGLFVTLHGHRFRYVAADNDRVVEPAHPAPPRIARRA